jgi:hypothetical protein
VTVHTELWVAVLVLGAIAAVALVPAVWRRADRPLRGTDFVLPAAVVFGILLWHVAGSIGGDALFHLARVRKLDDLDSLSLQSVVEFRDGGLHPGYAFPVWHGFLALVAKLAGVDPAAVVLHEAAVLAPLALLVAYEAGVRVLGSAAAGVSVLLAQVALIGLAAGNGGAYTALALPPTASRQLLVPAVIALVFAYLERPSWARLAPVVPATVALALVHPTYAVFLCIPLAGYAVVRLPFAWSEARRTLWAVGSVGASTLVAVLPIKSLAADTAGFTPDAAEKRRALKHYADQLDVFSLDRYRISPEVFGRTGAVAVAALVLLPLAALAFRRRWSAFVLGGSLMVFVLTLSSLVFPHFADVVSLSQARRAAGFVPFAFAFAGGAWVLATWARWFALPAALAAGIALQLAFPGDFGYGKSGGPAIVAWIAAWGAVAAIVAGVALRRDLPLRHAWIGAGAAVLFVIPVAVHGFANWSARPVNHSRDLTPGLVRALREVVPERAVVFADPETSYRVAAYAPVYLAVAPPEHVADTAKNRPYERREDVRRFLRTGDLRVPRRYGAEWIVVHRPSTKLDLPLPRVYADSRFVLYRLRTSAAAPSAATSPAAPRAEAGATGSQSASAPPTPARAWPPREASERWRARTMSSAAEE